MEQVTDSGSNEYIVMSQYNTYEGRTQNTQHKLPFFSRMFSSKMKQNKVPARGISPHQRRVQQMRTTSPNRQFQETPFPQKQNLYITAGNNVIPNPQMQEAGRYLGNTHYNVMFMDNFEGDKEKENKKLRGIKEYKTAYHNEKDIVLEDIRKNKTSFEVITVEDRGTDPWDVPKTAGPTKTTEDKGTDAMCPPECRLSICEEEKAKLTEELKDKGDAIKSTLSESVLLLEDLEKIKKRLSSYGKISEAISTHLKIKLETPTDFLYLCRLCLMDLAKQQIATQKQADAELQKLQNELETIKNGEADKESKIKNLERKLEAQSAKKNQEGQDHIQLQSKMGKLQDSLEAGKKLLKETEKSFKLKIEKLEFELSAQKQSNHQFTLKLEEKSNLVSKLEANVEKLQNSLEVSKQQTKEIQYSYKSKIAKLEMEHMNKVSVLCENQTHANKQLSQALDQSSNYVNQIQDTRRENASLSAANKAIHEKMLVMEKELIRLQERCFTAERKLSRETQEVHSLRNEVDRLETLKEEEILSVDGDTWCQIMHHQDQWILEDLRISLQEKENNLEVLRAQGDCALKDFEKLQSELQQRRQQFTELKDIFFDFEKKRDVVVREQRDFYNKMMLIGKKSIPRDRFYKNLIEECQLKSSRIEELENTVNNTNKLIEESQKISEAQLKAMQAEMKFTAEKLYEFENQIRMKEMQLQDVIKVFEQEKKHKTSAEEAMNTYKILLEDSKKENADLRTKLNYLEDFEKNRTHVLRATEDLARETQRRQDTEGKLKSLEKDFQEMKNQLQSKHEKNAPVSETLTSNKQLEQLKHKVKDLTEDKKYMERILMESQRSKEVLQKDKEELCKKLRHAVRVMVESKGTQEEMEMKLDARMHKIKDLEKSQANTEDRLDDLKDVLNDMKEAIEMLHHEKENLQEKLSNHIHCKAERAVNQELKILQREKAMTEEQNSREKEMLLQRLQDNENTIKDQHRHLRAFQEQLDSLNAQVRETKAQLASERHNHTQQLLNLQADKKKLELYIQELEGRLAYETRLRMQTSDTMVSSPKFFNSSDSYEPPNRDPNKHLYHRK